MSTGNVSATTSQALASVQQPATGTTDGVDNQVAGPGASTGANTDAAAASAGAAVQGGNLPTSATPATAYDASGANGADPSTSDAYAAAAADAQARAQGQPVAGSDAGASDANGGGIDATGASVAGHVVRGAAAGAAEADADAQAAAAAGGQPQGAADAAPAEEDPKVTKLKAVINAPSTGPAAWNESWRQKFVDIGTPSDVIAQLSFSGASGKDDTQLGAMLKLMQSQLDGATAMFEKKHPDEAKKLKGALDSSQYVNVALMDQGGQLSAEQLKQAAENPAAITGKANFLSMMKPMAKSIVAWTFIPGYGAIRYLGGMVNHGKDPISGEEIHYNFWQHPLDILKVPQAMMGGGGDGAQAWMDLLFALGGATSLYNSVKGWQTVSSGLKAMDAAKPVLAGGEGTLMQNITADVMKNNGLENGLSGSKRLFAHLPWSSDNKTVSALARMNDGLEKGLAGLTKGEGEGLAGVLAGKEGSTVGTRDLAQLVLDKWRAGEIEVRSRTGFGMLPFGLSSKVRGALPMVGDRTKPMFEWGFKDGKAVLTLDGRLTGQSVAAHLAAAGTKLLPRDVLTAPKELGGLGIPVSELIGAAAKKGPLATAQMEILGQAGKEMSAAKVLDLGKASSGLGKVWGVWRPGATDDVLKAVTALDNGGPKVNGMMAAIGKMPKGAKFGLMGAAAVGVGYLGYKSMFGAKPDPAPAEGADAGATDGSGAAAQGDGKSAAAGNGDAAQGADAQGAAAPAAGADAAAAGDSSQLTDDDVAALKQFQSLPLDQQQQTLQDGVTKLKSAVQAAGGDKMSDADAASLTHAKTLLEAMAQVAQDSANSAQPTSTTGTAGAQDAAAGAAQSGTTGAAQAGTSTAGAGAAQQQAQPTVNAGAIAAGVASGQAA